LYDFGDCFSMRSIMLASIWSGRLNSGPANAQRM
jgi:hypothetical protein